MRCHYEVLGVPRDVDGEELKKAYRKLALLWHPDKNLENITEATEQFRAVQQAYEILADPQERAFYDRYRESILKAGQGKADDHLDLFEYFDCNCYSGYNDGEKGFYTVYRHVFEKISTEDAEYRSEGFEDEMAGPSFGNSLSDYDDVVHHFYAHWQSYSTKSSYAWLYKHDIRDAPNRRVVRLMEKENKKIRDKARKSRNEEVRALVAFVRKRDKRVQEYKKQLEKKSAKSAQKVEENRRRQLEERRKVMENYQESNWAAMSEIEELLQSMEANIAKEFGDGESEKENPEDVLEDEPTQYYCIACDKAFKSERAFANHEKSKKHKENCAALKQAVQQEEELFKDEDLSDELEQDLGKLCIDDLVESNKTIFNVGREDVRSDSRRKKARKKKIVLGESSDDELQPSSVDTESLRLNNIEEVKEEAQDPPKVVQEIDNPTTSDDNKARNKPSSSGTKSKLKNKNESSNNKCVTCNCAFSSRNKLFDHLKTSGHSIAVTKIVNVKPANKKR